MASKKLWFNTIRLFLVELIEVFKVYKLILNIYLIWFSEQILVNWVDKIHCCRNGRARHLYGVLRVFIIASGFLRIKKTPLNFLNYTIKCIFFFIILFKIFKRKKKNFIQKRALEKQSACRFKKFLKINPLFGWSEFRRTNLF